MTNEEIKKAVQLRYDMIKICEADLKHIRSECKHEKTEKCNYIGSGAT